MYYSLNLQKAIKFAAKTHQVYQDQKRKGKLIPYIVHPLTVGLILSRAGADEAVIIAGILHDTIEDSPQHKRVSREMIVERFGRRVADLVESVTEKDRTLDYQQRKAEAFEAIASFSHNSVVLKSADVLSNVTEMVDDYARYQDEVFDRFRGSKKETIAHYLRVIKALNLRWPDNPLRKDLERAARELSKID